MESILSTQLCQSSDKFSHDNFMQIIEQVLQTQKDFKILHHYSVDFTCTFHSFEQDNFN